MLASAGDDGNVLLWVPSEVQAQPGLGEDTSDDKETWRVKHMCRSSGAEIYDLAWSPDGVFIMTGSMDNIARIYNAQNGTRSSFTLTYKMVDNANAFDFRANGTADRGTFALCARRCMGSSQRVRCHSIIGSIGPYLQLEDQGWPVYLNPARQSSQNGPASQAHFVQQSGSSRPCQ